MSRDNDERIAVLETEVKAIKEKQDEMLALQRTISDQLVRYKGFFGGVFFVLSAVGTLFTLIWSDGYQWLKAFFRLH